MDGSRQVLLQPSLSDSGAQTAAPYSMQTVFFSGFFGGPFATIGIMAANSVRLRRLVRDLPILLVMLGVSIGIFWWLLRGSGGDAAQAWLAENLGTGYRRYFSRFIGLALVGVAYIVHRREQRNATLLDIDRPNGWIGGIAAILFGMVVLAAVVALLSRP